jgi:biopolymer transport protein ExbB
MLLLALLTIAVAVVRPVVAQEGEAATTEGAAPATTEPPTTPDAGGGDAASAGKKQPSVLMWLIDTSGWIGLILLLLSFYFVATVVKMFIELRPEVTLPESVVQECENQLKSRDLPAVYKTVKGDSSFFSAVVAAGLAELQHGLPEARDAIERVGDAQVVEMEKKISMLAVIGTLGPMIGLLGTLKGMISSFSVIAISGTQMDAGEVAKGISEALVLTFEGVGLSVPAIYFFALFRNRISSLSTEAILFADEFIRRVNATMRSKPGPAPVSTAPAAPA